MLFFVSAIILLVFFAVLVVFGVFIDFISYHQAKKRFEKVFGLFVGQSFFVVEQDETHGSILENGLSCGDVFVEHGIVFFGFKKGDLVKIEPFPKFCPFILIKPRFSKTPT
jgi:hypothetical protein